MSAQEAMLELFASSTDGEIIRRGWLQALMKRLDAQLGMTYNMNYDMASTHLVCSDVFLEGTDTWRGFERMMTGSTMADVEATAETMAPSNQVALLVAEQLPDAITDAIWVPCDIQSGLATNIVEEGRFVGHLSLYRTGARPQQFAGGEFGGEARPWILGTSQLMSATHAMLSVGPSQRGTMLFQKDGTPWMQSELEANWASQGFLSRLSEQVRNFAAGEETDSQLHASGSRVIMSRLEGAGEAGILVVVEPMAVPKVSQVSTLTHAERVVSAGAARGLTVEQIAQQLSRSPDTIKTHLENIYRQLGISSRSELASMYETALDWKPTE